MNSNQLKVVIIDYAMGNVYSIAKACVSVNLAPKISSNKSEILNTDVLILPGVGAYGTAVEHLMDLDLFQVIIDFAVSGKLLVGICLGAQLLLQKSNEFGEHRGLGLISGNVIHISELSSDNSLIVPHIGWNLVYTNPSSTHPIINYIDSKSFYFIHSYVLQPDRDKDVLLRSYYNGIEFISAVANQNILGFQFHPENSGLSGLKIFSGIKKIIMEKV